MIDLFLDTTVLALAAGGDDPRRDACIRVLTAARDGRARLHVSTEAVQELVFHRQRRRDADALALGRELARLCILHPFDTDVLDEALGLMERGPVRGRDAVHAATALLAGFDAIVSTDDDFDGVAGLRRTDPGDVAL